MRYDHRKKMIWKIALPSKQMMQLFAYSWKLPACSGAFLLTVDNFSFLLTVSAFLLTVGALLLTMRKCA